MAQDAGTSERITPELEEQLRPGRLSEQRASQVGRRGYMLRRLTVVADVLALLATGAVSSLVLDAAGREVGSLDLTLFFVFVPIWPVLAMALRAYHPHSVGRGMAVALSDEIAPMFLVTTIWTWFLIVARSVLSPEPTFLMPSLLLWAIAIPTLLAARSAVRAAARRRGWYVQRVMVVGRIKDATKIISRLRRHPEWGLEVVGEIDVADEGKADDPDDPELTHSLNGPDIFARAQHIDASRVIFATPPGQLDARTDLTRVLIEYGVQVDFVPGEAEILRSGAVISHLEGLPLMSMPGAIAPRSWSALKRIMDLSIAAPVLVLASPLIAFAALRIKLDSNGPILYRQRRAGMNGEPFDFLKLRTMSQDADQRLDEVSHLSLHQGASENGVFKSADDPRVTKAGAPLRRLSLDELPQLWNVIRGDMSLVGPRPLPVTEDQRVAGHYELRRHVRPGMTGPWQVNGRSDIPFHDMLRLDYSYVLNWSLTGDFKLLLQTVDAVVRGRGAY